MTRYFKLKNENFDTDDFYNCSSVTNEVFFINDGMIDIILDSINRELHGLPPLVMRVNDWDGGTGQRTDGNSEVELVDLLAPGEEPSIYSGWNWALADVIEIDEQGKAV